MSADCTKSIQRVLRLATFCAAAALVAMATPTAIEARSMELAAGFPEDAGDGNTWWCWEEFRNGNGNGGKEQDIFVGRLHVGLLQSIAFQ